MGRRISGRSPLPSVAEDDDLERGAAAGGHGGRRDRPESNHHTQQNKTKQETKAKGGIHFIAAAWGSVTLVN